jgi:peptidoglycan/LPS O-acetylase OafA/YrhL
MPDCLRANAVSGGVDARGEIAALTGIRAFAAWWVVSFHLAQTFGTLLPGTRRYHWLVTSGDSGVDLFFVLSGFVLTINYAGKPSLLSRSGYLRFLWLRLARIYPTHLFALAVWACFAILNTVLKHKTVEDGYFGVGSLAAHLLLVHGWTVPLQMSWNYPAWSISMEWIAYLCFPAIMTIVGRIHSGRTAVWAIAALSLFAPLLRQAEYSHFTRIAFEFCIGCLLCRLYMRGVGTKARWDLIAIASLGSVVFIADALKAFILPVMVVIVYSVAFERGAAAAILRSRVATYWGRASYSLYMMHAACISAMHVLLPPDRFSGAGLAVRLLVLFAYISVIALAGSSVYHFIEEPFRNRVRAMLPAKRASLGVAAAA